MSSPRAPFLTALHGAFVAASGLAGDRVRWEGGNVSRPDPDGDATRDPYVTLSLSSSRSQGPPARSYSAADLGQPAGEEIEASVKELFVYTWRVTWYAGIGDEFADPAGDLERAIVRLALPTPSDTLTAAKISLLSSGGVSSLGGEVSATFEPRAFADLQIAAYHTESERVGYIATVELTETSITLDLPIELP